MDVMWHAQVVDLEPAPTAMSRNHPTRRLPAGTTRPGEVSSARRRQVRAAGRSTPPRPARLPPPPTGAGRPQDRQRVRHVPRPRGMPNSYLKASIPDARASITASATTAAMRSWVPGVTGEQRVRHGQQCFHVICRFHSCSFRLRCRASCARFDGVRLAPGGTRAEREGATESRSRVRRTTDQRVRVRGIQFTERRAHQFDDVAAPGDHFRGATATGAA